MDQERTGAGRAGRWLGWLVVLALTVAVAVGTVAVVGQVTERPLTRAAATPSAAPSAATDQLLGTPTSQLTGPLPDVTGRPVGEARPALEQLGAVVTLFDAQQQGRTVEPDWVACTAAGTTDGDGTATGEVQLRAVPAGEACS